MVGCVSRLAGNILGTERKGNGEGGRWCVSAGGGGGRGVNGNADGDGIGVITEHTR